MQQDPAQDASGPARPQTALPHARSGFRHWLATAVALAAVIGGALAVAPANGAVPVADAPLPTAAPSSSAGGGMPGGGAPAAPGGTPHALPASAAPDPSRAVLPLDCAGLPVKITQYFAADLRGDGTASTVVTAHCESPAGQPPDGVFILQRGPGGAPRVVYTLVRPSDDLTVLSVTLRSDGTLQAVAAGYSSTSVPRCCPDVHEDLVWKPQGSGYTRSVGSPGQSI